MDSGVFIGIDHGGSTTTSLVFDPERGKLASQSVGMPKSTPGVGLVEHNPDEFVDTSMASANGALTQAGLSWSDVQGIGIANQGETSMAWSSDTGLPLGPALSWEDKRTQGICDELASKGVGALVRDRTGVVLDPYFSATKFNWLKNNVDAVASAAKSGVLRLGGTDSYLIHSLTGGAIHATEPGTASRTALFNIRDLEWDAELVEAFGLNMGELPYVIPSCGDFGIAHHNSFGGARVPITANIVDAHAALLAQRCTDIRSVKATYGTGAFIEINTGSRLVPPDGNIPVFVAWDVDGKVDYTLEGGVFSVGSALDWAVTAGLLPSAPESARLALSVPDSSGVSMVPCLSGLSAPHWVPTARGTLSGIGLDTRPGHIARALLDGIAFQCAEIIRALDDKVGGTVREVCADGGPTKNPYLMQRQADLLNMPVSVSLESDMTGLGAAYLAAIGAGYMTVHDVQTLDVDRRAYEPAMGDDERESLWADWKIQVRVAIDQAAQSSQKS